MKKKQKKQKRNYWYCGLSRWFRERFIYTTEVIRTRDKRGKFVADDPSTPDVNEAYTVTKVKKPTKKGNIRARNKKGKYVKDDPSTPDVDEAYTKTRRKTKKKKKSD